MTPCAAGQNQSGFAKREGLVLEPEEDGLVAPAPVNPPGDPPSSPPSNGNTPQERLSPVDKGLGGKARVVATLGRSSDQLRLLELLISSQLTLLP